MKRTFIALNLLVLLFLCWQIAKDYRRPYLAYQRQFKTQLAKEGEGAPELAAFAYGARQRWLEGLNRVDRCETCHLGSEDPRFHDQPQPLRTHEDPDAHPFESFGCTVCHGGQGLATSVEDAHGPSENWNRAIVHDNFMQKSCSLCHGENIGDAAPVLTRGRGIFFADGCRGCHKIEGKARTKIAPPIRKLGEKARADWVFRWLRNPRGYLPKSRMPDFSLSVQQAADIALLLIPQPPGPTTPPAGSSEHGHLIFNESRCVTCHSVEGKGGNIGPDLAKIGSKVHADWLLKWLKNPQEMMPATRMPVYNLPEPDLRDLVSFLMGEYIDLELEDDKVALDRQAVGTGNLKDGKVLVEKLGCTGCHDIDGVEDRGEIGSELTRIGDVHISRLEFGKIAVPRERRTVPNWLYNKMRTPRLFKDDLKMPDYHFSDEDACAATTYLLSLTAEKVPSSYYLPLGQAESNYDPQGGFGKVLDKYRCLICHRINGRGGTLAPDLSQEGSRVREDWLRKFLKKPDTIRPILVERMPQFNITEADSRTIEAYFRASLLSDRVENLAGALQAPQPKNPEAIRRGAELYFARFACDACHQISLVGGTIGPDLSIAGERLRPEWVELWLRDPKTFLKRSVEPAFAFTKQEIEDLAAFLLSPKEKKSKP